MVTFDEAARSIRTSTPRLDAERVPLEEARGRVLLERIVSAESVPPFDASMVDGYAVHAADLARASAASPIELRIAREIPAGTFWAGPLPEGSAARLYTGSPVPAGADAVVPFEWTSWSVDRVRVQRAPATGAHVRRRGEDVRTGDLLHEAGRTLKPADLGVLASVGVTHVLVGRRPRVAFLCTGTELLAPGEAPTPGKIRGSNHLTLAGQIAQAGGIAIDRGVIGDDAAAIASALEGAFDADVLITSGGVSVGDHDLVKSALEAAGARRVFWRVAASPGKPVFFGVRDKTLVFGLPGNPVSSMVTFECFVRPALRRMQGDAHPERPRIRARLAGELRGAGARRHFARVTLHADDRGFVVQEVGPRGSGNLRSMSRANALAVIPEGTDVLPAGATVDVIVMDCAGWSFEASGMPG
jgi:molybdopterin molybdotransferase